jgi:hypothetical protein
MPRFRRPASGRSQFHNVRLITAVVVDHWKMPEVLNVVDVVDEFLSIPAASMVTVP